MSRFIVDEFDAAGIDIASATYDIVGFPPFEVLARPPRSERQPPGGFSKGD
jgi:hypothetical protein